MPQAGEGVVSMSTLVAEDPETGMDPVIERSWQRSSACGVAREAELSLPYDDHIDDDSRLLRAAEPVLDRLVGTMSNMRHALVLADPRRPDHPPLGRGEVPVRPAR